MLSVTICNEAAQFQISFRIGILEDIIARLIEYIKGRLLQGADRKKVSVRQAAGKRDDRGIDGDLEDFPDKGLGNVGDTVGECVFHGAVSELFGAGRGWADCGRPNLEREC